MSSPTVDSGTADLDRLVIAVDAMGGDKGPGVVLDGVLDAEKRFGGRYAVFGDRNLLERHLAECGSRKHSSIEIVHADDVITMHDTPVEAVREKKNSSLVLAARAVKEGRAAGFISPGNTGAMLAAGSLILGRIRGVERPGIATILPTANGYSILIDVGANVDCKASHLLHFGMMGAVYAKAILGLDSPRVGLLSIGEERSKGNALTKEALPLFEQAFADGSAGRGRFLGNVEGRDIVNGRADVIVCDGYTGNVVLKFGEALAFTIIDLMRERITATIKRKLGALLLKNAFREFKKKIDYTEYGGAPLLGVRQPCIICHGSSGAKAIMNAVRVTRQAIEHDICGRIATFVSEQGGVSAS